MYTSRAWKILDKFFHKLNAYFSKVLTIEEIIEQDLVFVNNVHGDFINVAGCRSLWKDKYGNIYRCKNYIKKEELTNHLGFKII